MTEEVWKDVKVNGRPKPGYQVSNLRRVKSLARRVPHPWYKQGQKVPERILMVHNGTVYLSEDKVQTTYKVEDLYREAFDVKGQVNPA